MDYCILWEFLALSRSAMLSRDGKAVACIKIKHRICCLQNKLKIEENYLYIFISKDFTRCPQKFQSNVTRILTNNVKGTKL